jgi:hypothetical protein
MEKVGKIYYTSWGYDQTNVDFYKAVRETAASVWVQKVSHHIEQNAFMAGNAMPTDELVGEVMGPFRINKKWGGFMIEGNHATEFDGKPRYVSWYA